MKRGYYFLALVAVGACAYLYIPKPVQTSSPKNLGPTSISDNDVYPQFCLEASKNPAVFTNFKRDPIYTEFLEHVSIFQGDAYLKEALNQNPEWFSLLPQFQKNDLHGNPVTHSYPGMGVFSPTTLRYIKVASDLKKHFGSLDNFNIVEIGGGYGGQCVVLKELFNIKNYTIIDLPGPIALTKTYLDKLGTQGVTLLTPDQIPTDQKYDLVISNYAFSECVAQVQKEYIDKVLSKSERGYLTMNYYDKAFSFYDLAQILSVRNLKIATHQEIPKTAEKNYLLTWK